MAAHKNVRHDLMPDGVEVCQASIELLGYGRVGEDLPVQLPHRVGETPAKHQSWTSSTRQLGPALAFLAFRV